MEPPFLPIQLVECRYRSRRVNDNQSAINALQYIAMRSMASIIFWKAEVVVVADQKLPQEIAGGVSKSRFNYVWNKFALLFAP